MVSTKNPDLRWKLLHLVPVAVLCLHCLWHWSYTSAETATLLCYARTLIEGGGLALQPDAIRSHGFSSLLWVLILAGACGLGLPLLASAKVIGILMAGGALYLLPRISRALNGRTTWRPVDLVAPSLLSLHPAIGLHAASGLETSLGLLLVVVALLLFVQEEHGFDQGRSCGLRSAVPLALLVVVYPEAPALAGALVLGRILSHATAGRTPSWRTWLWLGLLLIAYLLHLVWCYAAFADPWSGLLSVPRAEGVAGLDSAETLSRGWSWAAGLGAGWGLSLPLLLIVTVGALRAGCYWARIAIVAMSLANLFVVATSGGDPELGRRALPLALGLLILVGEGLDCLIARLDGFLEGRVLRRAVALALLCGVAALVAAAGVRQALHAPRSPWDEAMSRVEEVRAAVGESGWAPRQVKVLTASPGAFAWQRFRALDITGRTDPVVRRLIQGQERRALRRLIFDEVRPHVLVERPSQQVLHGFTRYPESARGYVTRKIRLLGRAATVSYSRRLLLEPAPWGDRPIRLQVAPHLWLLGVRVMPGRLLLLWMSDRGREHQGEVELRLGGWRDRISVGPRVYPSRLWRAGEVVRQVVPLDGEGLQPRPVLWIASERGGRVEVGVVSTEELRLSPVRWRLRRLRATAKRHGRGAAELMAISWRDPELSLRPLLDKITVRINVLLAHGLLVQAARQLALARGSIDLSSPGLTDLSRRLSREARERSRELERRSQWTRAVAVLRAASLADPSSPWIQRRLARAQGRLTEQRRGRLTEELELELAQRAQVLHPSARGLVRVMEAHLALDQAEEALIAFLVWRRQVDRAGKRARLLVAKALAQAGRPSRAMKLLGQLLEVKPPAPASRSCPPQHPLEALVLRSQIWSLAVNRPPEREVPDAGLAGDPIDLGSGSLLLARCVRSPPGEPVEVVLYLWSSKGKHPALDLMLGTRLKRLVLEGSTPPLTRLQVRIRMPPATYPVRLRSFATGQDAKGVEIGSVTVGPEANFGFELPSFGSSWQVQGTAFGRAPVTGRRARWHEVNGYTGERYADSYASSGGDASTGTLTSAPFLLSKSHLMMLVAGGDDPRVGVDLLVDGSRELSVRGERSMIFRPVFLPIARYRGRWARLVVRDNSRRRWGFIAVDEIRQLDGPVPGVAP